MSRQAGTRLSGSNGLKIAIEARFDSGLLGGVESVVVGLASGLSRLEADQRERYHFLAYEGSDDWLRPYIGGSCVIVRLPRPPRSRGGAVRAFLKERAPWIRNAWHALPMLPGLGPPPIPRSDGFVERAGMDVMHFPAQGAFLTDIPSIYQPHDLQHLHLPEFFSARQRAMREAHYRAFCRQARVVVVTSRWMRDDLVRHYELPPEKVAIVPWAPVVTEYPEPSPRDLDRARERLSLPDRFILYPAQTWPHKNHVGLIRALAILRARGLRVPLVASGFRNTHYAEIEQRARALGVEDLVHWVGFVSPLELQSLYRLTTAVVIPTLFEAASGPLWEAFAAGAPAACSNVTSLPAQADGAALIFDPTDPSAIADAVARLWTDPALRARLVARGHENVSRYDWVRTARMFRAHYRRLAGAMLTDHERDLLSAPSPL